VAGKGQTKTTGPYRVALTIIVLNDDGSLPLEGAIFRVDLPEGAKHVNELETATAKMEPKLTDWFKPKMKETMVVDLVDTDDEEDERKPAALSTQSPNKRSKYE
jgi:hypothetical protein